MNVCMHGCMYECMYVCMYACMCVCVCVCVCANTPIHAYMHTHIQVYIIYIYIYRVFCKAGGLTNLIVEGVDLLVSGLHMPHWGVRVGFDTDRLVRARQALLSFTAARPVRTAADLARPYRG